MDARRGLLARRTLLEAGVAAAGGLLPMACTVETRKPAKPEKPPENDVLDEAFLRFAETGPEYGGGLANHGPMAAEALVCLGRGDAVGKWIDGYERRLAPWPRSGGRIRRDAWMEALGKSERSTDWRDFFGEELREASFAVVLERWLPRLGPGVSGSAAHGLIRVAHAVRALAQRPTEPRRRELAAALAYSAISFHRLPDDPGENAKLGIEEAIDRIELVPEERRGGGSIVDRLAPLGETPSFGTAADLLDLRGDGSAVLSTITRAFARVYRSNAAIPDGRIARLHAVTGASAMRPLLPHVSAPVAKALLRYVWQLDAAVYATHASRTAAPPEIVAFPTSEDLVAAAVASGDEHAIKFTEVALRENAIAPDAAYLAAATHWVRLA